MGAMTKQTFLILMLVDALMIVGVLFFVTPQLGDLTLSIAASAVLGVSWVMVFFLLKKQVET